MSASETADRRLRCLRLLARGSVVKSTLLHSKSLSSQVRHSLAFIIIHGLIDYSTPKQQTRYPNCSLSSKIITKVKLAVLVLRKTMLMYI